MNERRVAGGVLVLLGALALLEARRLGGPSRGDGGGRRGRRRHVPLDHRRLAASCWASTRIFVARWPAPRVDFPDGRRAPPARRQRAACSPRTTSSRRSWGTRSAPWSSRPGSTAPWAAIGGRWPLLIGGVTTGALYLVFRVWLRRAAADGLDRDLRRRGTSSAISPAGSRRRSRRSTSAWPCSARCSARSSACSPASVPPPPSRSCFR